MLNQLFTASSRTCEFAATLYRAVLWHDSKYSVNSPHFFIWLYNLYYDTNSSQQCDRNKPTNLCETGGAFWTRIKQNDSNSEITSLNPQNITEFVSSTVSCYICFIQIPINSVQLSIICIKLIMFYGSLRCIGFASRAGNPSHWNICIPYYNMVTF